MSTERIDLSQFDGMKEWEVEKQPDGGYAIKTGRDNFSLEEAETIAKLTTLIAELKRCYERIDYLESCSRRISRKTEEYCAKLRQKTTDGVKECLCLPRKRNDGLRP
jgi:hypothetical protein